MTESQPALTLFLYSRPAFCFDKFFDQPFHFGFKKSLDPFAFEDDPVLIKAG
jgi:hypothetical protein